MIVQVTGCAGFIGWRVNRPLLEGGHTVIGADNLNDTYDVRLKRWRLNQLSASPGFKFHHADFTNKATVLPLFCI